MSNADPSDLTAKFDLVMNTIANVSKHIQRLEGQHLATQHVLRVLIQDVSSEEAMSPGLSVLAAKVSEQWKDRESMALQLQAYLQAMDDMLTPELAAKVKPK